MGIFLLGAALLAGVLGLFYLKDRLGIVWLARLAYSEFNMRLAVLAVALIIIGGLLMVSQFFTTPSQVGAVDGSQPYRQPGSGGPLRLSSRMYSRSWRARPASSSTRPDAGVGRVWCIASADATQPAQHSEVNIMARENRRISPSTRGIGESLCRFH